MIVDLWKGKEYQWFLSLSWMIVKVFSQGTYRLFQKDCQSDFLKKRVRNFAGKEMPYRIDKAGMRIEVIFIIVSEP